MNFAFQTLRIGRSIIAYNSLFVALIRYVYIVHRQKANQWNFDKVGKLFQIGGVAVPVFLEVIRYFTEEDVPGLKTTERFRNCVAINEGMNTTENLTLPLPVAVTFTLKVLPHQLVNAIYYAWMAIFALACSNVVEAFLYMKTFQVIKR